MYLNYRLLFFFRQTISIPPPCKLDFRLNAHKSDPRNFRTLVLFVKYVVIAKSLNKNFAVREIYTLRLILNLECTTLINKIINFKSCIMYSLVQTYSAVKVKADGMFNNDLFLSSILNLYI